MKNINTEELFHEWHQSYWGCDTYALDPQIYKNQKNAWDHQQKKIKKMEERYTKARESAYWLTEYIRGKHEDNEELLNRALDLEVAMEV